jgi:hypothetical protein
MQAVIDRPFGLSEWAGGDTYGGGEAIPMVAVYGMGLQGWDLSASFADDSSLLITTMARMADKGCVFDELCRRPVANPNAQEGPLLIEPVQCTVALDRRGPCRVHPLTHEGCLPPDAGALHTESSKQGIEIALDGSKSRAIYYLVRFD